MPPQAKQDATHRERGKRPNNFVRQLTFKCGTGIKLFKQLTVFTNFSQINIKGLPLFLPLKVHATLKKTAQ